MIYKYRAVLSETLRGAFFSPYVDIPTFFEAKDGFWINSDNEFTRDEDALFWIPPAQIKYVEKIG